MLKLGRYTLHAYMCQMIPWPPNETLLSERFSQGHSINPCIYFMGDHVTRHYENGSFSCVELVIDPDVTLYRLRYANAEVDMLLS